MAETGAEREVLKAEKDCMSRGIAIVEWERANLLSGIVTEQLDKELPEIISLAKVPLFQPLFKIKLLIVGCIVKQRPQPSPSHRKTYGARETNPPGSTLPPMPFSASTDTSYRPPIYPPQPEYSRQ